MRVTALSSWPWLDHPASGLPRATHFARFGLAFATAPRQRRLTLPHRVTRRLIMQKARCRSDIAITELQLLVDMRFQGLFHSLYKGSFHLSLTVLVHYRSLESI